jgi:formyltetrahydrofolate hydrolase
MKPSAILLVSCPDAKGEVATIADFVYRRNGNILHADEQADEESGLFLMRVEFDPKDFDIDLTDKKPRRLRQAFLSHRRKVLGEMATAPSSNRT